MDGVKTSRSLLSDGGKRVVAVRPYLIVLYAANLIAGWFATFGLSSRIGAVTGTNLYSERLVHGFDLGVFLELIDKPEIAPYSQIPLALVFAVLFVVFQLFLTGGIITRYLTSERVDRARFYASCGENFWKMVRAAIVFVVVAGLVAGILHLVRSVLDTATENSANRQAALALQCGMLLIEALALLWVRMWFDLTQTQLVATGVRGIRSSVAYGFRSARSAGGLYGSYVVLGILTALVAALGLYFWWTAAPASQVIVSFLILQSTLACLLVLRWWQHALAAGWYERNTQQTAAIESVSLEPLPPESAVPEVPLSQ
jgi:hypothetical protein